MRQMHNTIITTRAWMIYITLLLYKIMHNLHKYCRECPYPSVGWNAIFLRQPGTLTDIAGVELLTKSELEPGFGAMFFGSADILYNGRSCRNVENVTWSRTSDFHRRHSPTEKYPLRFFRKHAPLPMDRWMIFRPKVQTVPFFHPF